MGFVRFKVEAFGFLYVDSTTSGDSSLKKPFRVIVFSKGFVGFVQ